MQRQLFTRFLFVFFLFSVTGFFSGCEKFKGDQTIPAYITIDSIFLTTTPASQGSSSALITDAWVYINDVQIGTFQLPARFPVLYTGKQKIKILPGIKQNGVAATRASYPFFSPIEKEITLGELDTTAIGVVSTTYLTSTLFELIEDFEGVTCLLDTTTRSEAALGVTSGPPLTFEGSHSGMVVMDSLTDFFECVNDRDFLIPYAPVYLELNFNTNNVFAAGVYLYGATTIQQVPVVYMNPTYGSWKKIYIDLTNTLNGYTGFQKFRIFFSAIKSTEVDSALILMDNVKVVTRTTK